MMVEELNINPLVAALNGGEDYELLFTLSSEDAEKLKNAPDFKVVGEITEAAEGVNLITTGGSKIELQAQGGVESRKRVNLVFTTQSLHARPLKSGWPLCLFQSRP
jgi:thiamine monophosphate kinase